MADAHPNQSQFAPAGAWANVDRHGVLITRPASEAETTARHVEHRGFVPVLAPLLTVESRPVASPGAVAGIVFTSGNAVRMIGSHAGVPVFAVGDATAARARDAGFQNVISAGGNGVDLVALIRARCPANAALLFVSGAGRGMEVADGLRAAGFTVRRRVGYTARPVRRLPEPALAALRDARLRACLFLSAETARVFVRVLPAGLRAALAGIDALAIGPQAAEALAPLPWRRVRVSVGPTLEQVLALL